VSRKPSQRAPRGPKPGEWKYTVGEVPHLLTAFERKDKGNAIYTRVWDGGRYTNRKALCAPIRDEAGRIVPDLEIQAQTLAVRRLDELLRDAEPEEVESGGPLTVAGGFRRLLHRREGKYPSDTAHRREVVRAGRIIQEVLGRDLRWDRIRHREYRKVWRHIAREHVKDPKRFGLRTAEIVCGVLQSASRWLQQEGLLEPGDALPAPGWKQAMRAEWEQITEAPLPRTEKPRYADAESRRLWAAVPQADPRIALAMELGAELRLGQVARVRRSDVLPSPDGRFRIGMVQVHGRGKKHGETIVLTTRQRHVLTRALLLGFLALPEAAYQRGEIEDYFLIAGGHLHTITDRRGRKVKRVRVKGAEKYMGRRAMGRRWEELEALARVDHIDGRLWYGMRRLQADKAEAMQGVDARVKKRMGGWTKTSTREEYLEEANVQDAIAAARVRRQIRPEGTP
jgi:hypothetical protein